jgi:hypothetical protein
VVGVQGGLAPLARELGVDGLFPEAGAVVGWNLLELDPEDLLQGRRRGWVASGRSCRSTCSAMGLSSRTARG